MIPEYDLIDFAEQAWTLRCTRCRLDDVMPVAHRQTAAEQFTEAGWELREGPRVLCPTCVEETA